MNIRVKYGTGNEITKDFPAGTNIGCVLSNPNIRAILGYGQNVAGHVGGVPQNDATSIFEGMVISVADKSCSKAVGVDSAHPWWF